jgi:S-adenosylmethionine:tRNA ribosyltransferase-isomerase
VKTSDFDYFLPPELIAQTPVEPRDHSRLMILNRKDGSIEHREFFEIVDYLQEGDVLVFNDSRVIPARLYGRRADSGGRVEILLLRRLEAGVWEALTKRGKRLRPGTKVEIKNDSAMDNPPEVIIEVIGEEEGGIKVLKFSDETKLPELGKMPLPPYIHTPLVHPERYQTVYARVAGSVAAPTAGLHFTPELLKRLEQKGVHLLFVSLHIGLDTFNPVREEDPREHYIHREFGVLSEETARQLSQAKGEARRIICVGTTTVRMLEQAAQLNNPLQLQPFEGWISLFILPGYSFQMADALITNFHLPRSTLLMLVTAFAGKELVNRAYQEAIASGYRFYSFGDAMLVL